MKLGIKQLGKQVFLDTLGQQIFVNDLVAFKRPYTHGVMEVAKIVELKEGHKLPYIRNIYGSKVKIRTIFVKIFDQKTTK